MFRGQKPDPTEGGTEIRWSAVCVHGVCCGRGCPLATPNLTLVSVCYRIAKFLAIEIVHAETLLFFSGIGARSSSILERNSLRIGEVFALL